jgi:hypothetical protein
MLIAISGKIGSGKDLVGKIIQYLVWNKINKVEDITCIDYINGKDDYYSPGVVGDIDYKISCESNWQIKKFADKLKDIVCILLGCTREQLEDREFKEKELGEEWWFWKLERDGGYRTILFPYHTNENVKSFQLIKLTPRLFLQFIGTDLFRNQLHPKVWINATMAEYELDEGFSYKVKPTRNIDFNSNIELKVLSEPKKYNNGYPNWIITDTRFPEELQDIKDRDGITIRVNRLNSTPQTVYVNKKDRTHPSETALDDAKFDYVIDNNGTIEELIEKVKEILIKEKIL